jgi:hypothetical protein
VGIGLFLTLPLGNPLVIVGGLEFEEELLI